MNKSSLKYRFMVFKTYFDTGYGVTGYFKYLIAFVGIGGAIQGINLLYLLLAGLFYGVCCYIIGRIWYKYRMPEISYEIDNKFNPFVADVRKEFGLPHDSKI